MPAREMAVPSDLDKLLTEYLNALDRYTQVREELARYCSDVGDLLLVPWVV
jgi:hypothetical protein